MGQKDAFAGSAIALLAMIFLLAGFKLMYEAVKSWNVENSEIVQTLIYSPKTIVWIYSVVTENMPFGVKLFRIATVYFKLINGDQITMHVPAKLVKQVSESLNDVLPHATFGYSKEKEQWYIAEPGLLYRDC